MEEFIGPEHLTRQLDIIPLDVLDQNITVVGAGAIGSWVVLSLAKMGFSSITVFDDDEVTIENMNCQFFPHKAIGEKKVESLAKLTKLFADMEIQTFDVRYVPGNRPLGIVISAVDSMEARRMIWEDHKDGGGADYIIDPRMGAETSLMYVMNPNNPKDITAYEKTLYTDENAVQERCTAKSTIYTANLLAGQVCKAVKDIVCGHSYTRVSMWDIGNNSVQLYNSEG